MSRKGWACERVRLQKVAQLILPPHPHRRPSDTRPRLFLGCFAYRDQLQRRDFLQFDHRDGIVTDVADRDHAFRLHLFEISPGFDSGFFPVSMRARLTIYYYFKTSADVTLNHTPHPILGTTYLPLKGRRRTRPHRGPANGVLKVKLHWSPASSRVRPSFVNLNLITLSPRVNDSYPKAAPNWTLTPRAMSTAVFCAADYRTARPLTTPTTFVSAISFSSYLRHAAARFSGVSTCLASARIIHVKPHQSATKPPWM
jgi:hypothetical protein